MAKKQSRDPAVNPFFHPFHVDPCLPPDAPDFGFFPTIEAARAYAAEAAAKSGCWMEIVQFTWGPRRGHEEITPLEKIDPLEAAVAVSGEEEQAGDHALLKRALQRATLLVTRIYRETRSLAGNLSGDAGQPIAQIEQMAEDALQAVRSARRLLAQTERAGEDEGILPFPK